MTNQTDQLKQKARTEFLKIWDGKISKDYNFGVLDFLDFVDSLIDEAREEGYQEALSDCSKMVCAKDEDQLKEILNLRVSIKNRKNI